MSLSSIVDRLAVTDAIHGWCTAIDSRDWAAMRRLLSDPVHIDYSSNGSIAGDLPVDTWIARLHGLHGFDRTLHMVSNLVITVTDNDATCTSYINALHFLKDGDQQLGAYACGIYIHRLSRAGEGWIITSAKFDVAGRYSDSAEYDRAFVRAREIAPSRMPARG